MDANINLNKTSSGNPNYLNMEGTSREVSWHEFSSMEGTISDILKNNDKILLENTYYLGEEIIITTDVIDVYFSL